jgi:hypothetical protein
MVAGKEHPALGVVQAKVILRVARSVHCDESPTRHLDGIGLVETHGRSRARQRVAHVLNDPSPVIGIHWLVARATPRRRLIERVHESRRIATRVELRERIGLIVGAVVGFPHEPEGAMGHDLGV